MNKRGLNSVIVSVLLVLVALAATAIAWGMIKSQIESSAGKSSQIIENIFSNPQSIPENNSSYICVDGADNCPPYKENYDGFVYIKEGHFYRNGERIRLMGPSYSVSILPNEKLASKETMERLKYYGFNSIRPHLYEHRYYNGARTPATTRIFSNYEPGDESTIDNFDYLLSEARNNNLLIYLSFDRVRAPIVPSDSGICGDECGDAAGWERAVSELRMRYDAYTTSNYIVKHLWFFDERVKRLHFEYAKNVLEHENKYTGLKVKDDPSIALFEVSNENNAPTFFLGTGGDYMYGGQLNSPLALPQYFQDELRAKWTNWLKGKYGTNEALQSAWDDGNSDTIDLADGEGIDSGEEVGYAPLKADFSKYSEKRADDLVKFINDMVSDYHIEFEAYARANGLKVPLIYSNSGYQQQHPFSQVILSKGNVISAGQYTMMFDKTLLTKESGTDTSFLKLYSLAQARVKDKPFIIYENNVFNPARYRGTYLLMIATIASLQDWDAVFFHNVGTLSNEDAKNRGIWYEGRTKPSSSFPVSLGDFALDWNGCRYDGDELYLASLKAASFFTRGTMTPLEGEYFLSVGTNSTLKSNKGTLDWFNLRQNVLEYNDWDINANSFLKRYSVRYTNEEGSYYMGDYKKYTEFGAKCVNPLRYLGGVLPGIISNYKMNGNANDEQGKNNGELKGGITCNSPGIEGSSCSFDGSLGKYINILFSSTLQPENGISIDSWINPSAFPSGQMQIATHESYSYRLSVTDGKLHFLIKARNTSGSVKEFYAQADVRLKINEWQYVAATYNASEKTMSLYVNGVIVKQTVFTGMEDGKIVYPSNNGVSIGKGTPGSWREPFNGFIDETEIYGRALTEEEICASAGRSWSGRQEVINDNFKWDLDKGLFVYDNPNLKMYTGLTKDIQFNGVSVSRYDSDVENYSSFVLQSLDNQPVSSSGMMRISLFSVAENTGLNYYLTTSGGQTNYTLASKGSLPVIIEKPKAIIRIDRTNSQSLTCQEKNLWGDVLSEKPCVIDNGVLTIDITNDYGYTDNGRVTNAVFEVNVFSGTGT